MRTRVSDTRSKNRTSVRPGVYAHFRCVNRCEIVCASDTRVYVCACECVCMCVCACVYVCVCFVCVCACKCKCDSAYGYELRNPFSKMEFFDHL
jgi:hypothetical protein